MLNVGSTLSTCSRHLLMSCGVKKKLITCGECASLQVKTGYTKILCDQRTVHG